MRKAFAVCLFVLVFFTSQPVHAETKSPDFLHVQSELQSVLTMLSDNLNRFEYLQKQLQSSGKDNKSYDEYKNIWLSTILAINAISSICEYENDLLTLFMDLKEKRRVHYIEVRIKSLENSVQQIAIMDEQIQINLKLMPPDLTEISLFDMLKQNIDSSINLLKKSRRLILQLKQK
ncbi:MAG: hypothetical protein ABIK98_02595 [Pseudomonadota bacterium]|nr:hypothetical protein [Pseudomonadota bacterium]